MAALQDGTFDVVTCQYGLFFMPEHVAALREAARVLRPGGLLAASVFGTGNQMPQVGEATGCSAARHIVAMCTLHLVRAYCTIEFRHGAGSSTLLMNVSPSLTLTCLC